MKVSVIIPTYNREEYICQAVESVLDQTLTDIEIIVIDDGSSDNTKEKLIPYSDRIKYVYIDNKGPAHARNTGMKMAQGKYISFLDSDDLYYPYKAELQYELLEKFHDAGMVFTELSGFDDNGFWDEYHLMNYHSSAYKNGGITYENIFPESTTFKEAGLNFPAWSDNKIFSGNIFDAYFQNLIVFTNSIMFRRDILGFIGYQPEEFRLFEEYDFALRICKEYKVAFVAIPTYKLRYHSNQISDTSKRDGVQVVIKKQERLLSIAETYGLKNDEYYSKNKESVNKRLAVLHKALAIPLMAKGKRPGVAREHLIKCGSYGHSEYLLWSITFVPYVIRRIIIKLLTLLRML